MNSHTIHLLGSLQATSESLMAHQIEQFEPLGPEASASPKSGRIGWAGLLVFPIALGVYLLALPLFALFWIIEWALPLRPNEPDPADRDQAVAGFHSPAKESSP